VLQELRSHKIGLSAFLGMGIQEVGEEENLQYDEDDKELDGNDQPKCFPQRHAAETIIVKVEGTVKETVVCHRPYYFNVGKDRKFFSIRQKKD
jgi:hypothetical protein